MRKPLYLDIAQAKAVELEAVALRVVAHEQADSFYPLRRVSRVVVTGKVKWETAALLACFEYGIPVAFRGRDGHLFGHCLSDRSSQVSLESLLEACADNPAGDAQYLQWRVHEENQWGQRVARVMGMRLPSASRRGVVGRLWSGTASVRSGRRTWRPASLSPSNACGEVTSWTRWRSI